MEARERPDTPVICQATPDGAVLTVLVCLALMVLGAIQVEAQWRPTRHFTVKDGLVQSQISAIDQDVDGFLWFATEAGLCRFDGVRFRRFTRTEGLPDSVMVDVCAHGDEVWVATERGGLVIWDGNTLEEVADLPLNPDELLTGVQLLADGTVIASSRQGVIAGRPGGWRRISTSRCGKLARATPARSSVWA